MRREIIECDECAEEITYRHRYGDDEICETCNEKRNRRITERRVELMREHIKDLTAIRDRLDLIESRSQEQQTLRELRALQTDLGRMLYEAQEEIVLSEKQLKIKR